MLTNEDIEMLMKGLDALERYDVSQAFGVGIFGAITADNKEQAHERFTSVMQEARKKSDRMKDQIILLKAKLIQLKDRNAIDETTKILKEGRDDH